MARAKKPAMPNVSHPCNRSRCRRRPSDRTSMQQRICAGGRAARPRGRPAAIVALIVRLIDSRRQRREELSPERRLGRLQPDELPCSGRERLEHRGRRRDRLGVAPAADVGERRHGADPGRLAADRPPVAGRVGHRRSARVEADLPTHHQRFDTETDRQVGDQLVGRRGRIPSGAGPQMGDPARQRGELGEHHLTGGRCADAELREQHIDGLGGILGQRRDQRSRLDGEAAIALVHEPPRTPESALDPWGPPRGVIVEHHGAPRCDLFVDRLGAPTAVAGVEQLGGGHGAALGRRRGGTDEQVGDQQLRRAASEHGLRGGWHRCRGRCRRGRCRGASVPDRPR